MEPEHIEEMSESVREDGIPEKDLLHLSQLR